MESTVHKLWIALSLLLAVLAFGPVARAEVVVVATVPSLAVIAKEVGGQHAKVTSLSLPTQDPHFVDAKPSLALELNKADLLLAVGLELELGWLPVLQTGARNPKVQAGSNGFLDVSQFVNRLGVPQQPVDRSAGDIHPGGNPHYLYDPRAAAAVAKGIAVRLGDLDPPRRGVYHTNLEGFLKRLQAARAGWEARLAKHRGAPVITYHKSWVYLLDWLGLKEIETLEPKPGIPPNPAHVARVLVAARTQKARAILQESYYPDQTAKLIAEKSGARLVVLPGGADFRAGQTYIDHMEQIVTLLEKGLGG
jgi:zinc/manganese transport system substrate-binding protein